MRHRFVRAVLSIALIAGCDHAPQVTSDKASLAGDATGATATVLSKGIADPHNPYDVVRYLLSVGELDYGHSLLAEAEPFQVSESDLRFMGMSRDERAELDITYEDVEIGPDSQRVKVKAIKSIQSRGLTGVQGPLLSKEQTEEVIAQLHGGPWTWEPSRHGFDQNNDSSYYSLSRPLVTRDGNHILMTVEDLCRPFLCGRGWNLEIARDSTGWNVNRFGYWYH